MNKQERKRLASEYIEKQKKEFNESLPMPRKMFKKLFDYLDKQSEENICKHNLDMTIAFLQKNNCPIDTVIKWLQEYGGAGCDCEVLLNTEEYFE